MNEDVGEHLAGLTRGLDAAWRQTADRLAGAELVQSCEPDVPSPAVASSGRAESAAVTASSMNERSVS
ncbi:hypothetical protein WKI65_28220 [Streptomyces sp. MS1.AVA.3]|uniref:hypothetical protein n=1 Tax=Streptomyces decoyicus TaxID=249567 RepID=UPI0030C54B40